MNSLSWFIYAVQVIDGLRDVAAMALLAGGLLGFLSLCGLPIIFEIVEETDVNWRCGLKWYVVSMAVAGIIAVALPSRQTMILIAGSEMGERVVKSEAVQSIVDPGLDLVKTWIKEETEKLKPKGSK